jgi:Tol biopolymer transport system component
MNHRCKAALLLLVIACVERGPMTPVDPPPAPLFALADCDLGMSDSDALTAIDALIAQVDVLEAAGTLSEGRAQALRNHLRNARDQLLAGRHCPAQAQLRAFRDQVSSFVANGALSPDDAAPLLDGVGQVLVNVIAFASRRDGNYEIYIINLDGTGLTRLTDHPRVDVEPDWSPDGSRIVFFSARDGVLNDQGVINNGGLYVMDADGSDVSRIYFREDTDNDLQNHPRWSPDGTRILFASGPFQEPRELYLVNADGSGLTPLAPELSNVGAADWSPDGSQIVFAHAPTGGADIYIMNADGSGVTALTTEGTNLEPAWSPDGSRIAFVSFRDGNLEIYVMNTDGTNQIRLTSNSASDGNPRWSPDSRMLVFESNRDGNSEIYVMNADGTAQTRLTDHPAIDLNPAWRR